MNWKTQMEAAKRGIVTPMLTQVATAEKISRNELMELIAAGQVAIPANRMHHSLQPAGIGKKMRTKINANIGISGDCRDYHQEMKKFETALFYGADSIMDLSNYGKTHHFRKKLIEHSTAMIGTVPLYDACGYYEKETGDLTAADFLNIVKLHAEQGVDFMTIHAGMNRHAIQVFERNKRQMNIVSRGGALLFLWMKLTGNENPYYEHYDQLLDILAEYDVTISLGDALRPGSIADSSDAAQLAELSEIGALTLRAWEKNVSVIVEGPGHMPIHEIAANVTLEKKLCHGAPFYVLGPLVTDIAPGYDHIAAAIGGAVAASHGADFLCYVTPAEHLRLPDLADVKEGIIASKIAAHAADISKGIPGSQTHDYAISETRRLLNWEETFKLALDGEKAQSYFASSPPSDKNSCSMCGKMCAVNTMNNIGKNSESLPRTVCPDDAC